MKEIEHHRHGKIRVTDHVFDLIEKDKREWCPQRSPEWYEKRRNHITASVMAAICNANEYESRISIFKRKVGCGPTFRGNAATEWGNKYEDVAIEKYEKLKNERVLEFGLLESLNPGEEFLAGSPDGITASGKLIEVKCPFRRTPTEEVPSYYIYQVQFLMHTLRLKTCDFIQFVPENTWNHEVLIITRVDYNPDFFRLKWKYLTSFWDSVLETRAIQEEKADAFDIDQDIDLQKIGDVKLDKEGNVMETITIPERKRKSSRPNRDVNAALMPRKKKEAENNNICLISI